jgi:hypothetical protein
VRTYTPIVKWSGSSGPRNVFFNNAMTKQVTAGAAYTDYYADRHRIYQFGWDGAAFHHLDAGGTPITDWAHNEQRDFTGGHGVDATKTDAAGSLFLKSVTGAPTTTPTMTTTTTAPPASCLTASFAQTSTWSTGYTAKITVANECATSAPTRVRTVP